MLPDRTEAGDDHVIVIGSGPCGAIAAKVLVDAGIRVTMLEAGLQLPKGVILRAGGHTLLRWRSQQELLSARHRSLGDPSTEWFSSLSPGGLSNYWTAAVPRFAPEDFSDGGRLDARFAWPVSYDDLVPFYGMVEDLLKITGPEVSLPVLPAGRARYRISSPPDWQALGDSMDAPQLTVLPLARGGRWMLARRGSEFNSYHVIVKPLEQSASFELRLGARVDRLLVSDSGDEATGVEYVDVATMRRQTMRARAIVLAAGTIDSTRVLLNSTSRSYPNGLGNDGGLVGRYLHDHPKEWWMVDFERPLTMVDHPLYLAREPYAGSTPLSGSSATIGMATQRQRPKALAHRKSSLFGVQVFSTMVPEDVQGVQLVPNGGDAGGAPIVDIRMRYSDVASATLHAVRERFESVFAAVGNPVRVLPVDWTPRPGASVHFGGTARMHESAEFGVVDKWSRLHRTRNVVVADLSTFTTNPEKNPTLTAMALAARAAGHLVDSSR